MAIAKMQILDLVALAYDRDKILNALRRTNAVEIKKQTEIEGLAPFENNSDELSSYYSSVEAALSLLTTETESYIRDRGIKTDVLKDGFEVGHEEFMSMADKKQQMDEMISRINGIVDKKMQLKGALIKAEKLASSSKIYLAVTEPLSLFSATAHTYSRLGTFPLSAMDALNASIEGLEHVEYEVLNSTAETVLAHFVCAKEEKGTLESLLSEIGFADCPFDRERSGEDIHTGYLAEVSSIKTALSELEEEVYSLSPNIKDLKIYSDYVCFNLEKESSSENFLKTEKTFALKAYVPEEGKDAVSKVLDELDTAVWYSYSEPTETDEPPTLLLNNKIVSNFETITNTYSAPNYREFDPNTVMAFFYSLFMGFIIADAGYGLLMLLGGGYMWLKQKNTGMGKLCGVFAIGGIFAIVWGLLFNSLLGMQVFSSSVIPDPQTSFWSLAGIRIPSVLIISLIIGIVQIFVGYVCKIVQLARRGDVLGGICEGATWAMFSVGVELAIIGFVEEFNLPSLVPVGGIMAGVSLALAALTAGRKEKFIGKFTKGFGAIYGVINYASDILSYARLYGLMLSGAVIASIISQFAVQFMSSGVVGVIAGIILMIVGHGFNVAISLLGAYIHDSRLQYVEFFSRFFEGEGTLFAPLGSSAKYSAMTTK